jgi:hypothetical protein
MGEIETLNGFQEIDAWQKARMLRGAIYAISKKGLLLKILH